MKPIEIISYEVRISKMINPGDEDKQLRLAKKYVLRLRNLAKNADSLEEKIALNEAVKGAESVVLRIRSNIFELEDMLASKSGKKLTNREVLLIGGSVT